MQSNFLPLPLTSSPQNAMATFSNYVNEKYMLELKNGEWDKFKHVYTFPIWLKYVDLLKGVTADTLNNNKAIMCTYNDACNRPIKPYRHCEIRDGDIVR